MRDVVGSLGDGDAASPGQWLAVDPQRLAALESYQILDTPIEPGFDDVVRLATRLCAAPIALVSLVAADRQWFKARIGFPLCETDLSRSVCAHALAEPDLLIIPDLSADARTAGNPLVTGDPAIRFYAGAPLRTQEGQALGTLCVIDTAPRPGGLSAEQADDLRALSRHVVALLSLRRAVQARDQMVAEQRGLLRQAGQLGVLAKAAVALATASDPAAVLEPILAANANSVGFEQCFIYDFDPGGEYLRLIHSVGVSDKLKAAMLCARIDEPLCGVVVQTRQPLTLRDLLSSTEPRYALAREHGVNGYAGYPVWSRGELVGVISFATAAPAFDDGALSFFAALAALVSDVRERLDREATMRESEARSRRAQEAGRVGTYELDIATGSSEVSPELCRIFGLPPARRYPAATFTNLAVPDDWGIPSNEATRKAGTAALEIKYRIRRANDGALRWIERTARFTHHPDGTPASMVGTVRDITEQQVLTEELSHRLKNTFAIVLSIAAQSFRGVADRAPVQAFEERIRALSAAHDVLVRQSWGPAPIEDVVRSVLTGTGQLDRVDIAGPPIELGARAVLSLSLLLHEMATNAAKYGSLSVPAGHVAASWRLEGEAGSERLVIEWIESGGPRVVPPASSGRKGFGSRLIQMGLTGTGGVELRFLPDGLRATITAPLSSLHQA